MISSQDHTLRVLKNTIFNGKITIFHGKITIFNGKRGMGLKWWALNQVRRVRRGLWALAFLSAVDAQVLQRFLQVRYQDYQWLPAFAPNVAQPWNHLEQICLMSLFWKISPRSQSPSFILGDAKKLIAYGLHEYDLWFVQVFQTILSFEWLVCRWLNIPESSPHSDWNLTDLGWSRMILGKNSAKQQWCHDVISGADSKSPLLVKLQAKWVGSALELWKTAKLWCREHRTTGCVQ